MEDGFDKILAKLPPVETGKPPKPINLNVGEKITLETGVSVYFGRADKAGGGKNSLTYRILPLQNDLTMSNLGVRIIYSESQMTVEQPVGSNNHISVITNEKEDSKGKFKQVSIDLERPFTGNFQQVVVKNDDESSLFVLQQVGNNDIKLSQVLRNNK